MRGLGFSYNRTRPSLLTHPVQVMQRTHTAADRIGVRDRRSHICL